MRDLLHVVGEGAQVGHWAAGLAAAKRPNTSTKVFVTLVAASEVHSFCQQGGGEELVGCAVNFELNQQHHLTALHYKAALLISLIQGIFIRPRPPEVLLRRGPWQRSSY